jgi:tetratricopeptide (TPR) repeat protein
MGCGVAITQQSAQRAVSNAQVAVSDAKAARASQYSMEKMKRAERLLEDAEEALSRNRKQRAYTLAMNASKLARMAEQEANAQIADAGVSVRDYVSTPAPAKTQPATVEYKTVTPAIPQSAIVVPKKQEIAMPPARTAPSAASGYEMPPQQVPGIAPSSVMPAAASISISDAQSAIQALDEAQNAIDTARATIVRAKVEIGLAILKATVQQLSMSGGSTDMFNAVKAWYDYAQRAAEVGNYEEALRAIERAQSYAQGSGMPMR